MKETKICPFCGGTIEPLTLEQLKQLDGEPVFCIDSKENGKWAFVQTGENVCVDSSYEDWEFYCYGWMDDGELNRSSWLAYRVKPDEAPHEYRAREAAQNEIDTGAEVDGCSI